MSALRVIFLRATLGVFSHLSSVCRALLCDDS